MPGQTYTFTEDSAPHSGRHYTAIQRAAVKDWAAWTGLLILAIMLFLGFVLIILGRERRIILGPVSARAQKKKPKRQSGWVESGRRLDVRELGTADDDTVDIDPDELGPGDVDEGPESNPRGHGPKPPKKGGPNQ
jgi:hypothetical protein